MAVTRNSRSPDPVEAVAAALLPRLRTTARVCVALSGGRDSVALLHAAAELAGDRIPGLRLSALHVHHGLSAHADAWADFCAGLCRRLGIPFQCVRVIVDRRDPAGLEAAARRARYAAFAACDADWLLLAHHRDDQAETLLLNLLRGAGARGLAGMPETRGQEGCARLLRPFLTLPRAAIDAWLVARKLSWIDDDSNEDERFRRNLLRRQVMPLLAQQFPDPAATLARAAGHLAELAALADDIAADDARGAIDAQSLSVAALNALPASRRANLLRLFLRRQRLRMPDSRHLSEMLRQMSAAAADATPCFLVDGATLSVSRGRLWGPAAAGAGAPSVLLWDGACEMPWGDGRVVLTPCVGRGLSQRALQAAADRVELRARRGGEVLCTDARRPRRTLKKLLQEAGVPLWERRAMPLLCCGDRLLWVPGIGCTAAADFVATGDEPGWWPTWERPGKPSADRSIPPSRVAAG